jgi:hypothetical protein
MLSRPAPLWHHSLVGLSAVATIVTSLAGSPPAAWALSDIPQIPGQQQTEEPDSSTAPEPTEDEKSDDDAADPGLTGIPDPDPLINKPGEDQTDADSAEPQKPPPEVIYDISKAPEPVRRMRELMIEAAASGDIERLRALMNPGPNQTQIQLGTDEDDPVAKLKSLSGDPDGVEILAILIDILSTGFVRVDAGTRDEAYVWPYFAEKPLSLLTPPEKVELLRIVTAGDFAEMEELGNYNFFRLGISPDGQWKFFAAGD